MSGTISPNHAGKQVRIYRKKGAGSWRPVKTLTLGAGSGYTWYTRLTTKGTYYFKTHFPGDADHQANWSAVRRLVVS